MKTLPTSSFRTTALASTLFLLSLSASAKDTTATDHAAQLLARHGSILLAAAGPYVEVGTYRVQVSAKLGRPTARLNDDTWIYENFQAEDSSARGMLIVRFEQGRVRLLSLATPAAVIALRNSYQDKTTAVVATNVRR